MAVEVQTRCSSRLALSRCSSCGTAIERHGYNAQPNGLRILRFLLAVTLFLAAQTPVLGQSWPQISFGDPIGGFSHPTHLASARDGSGRLFVVEQPGRIRIIKNGALVATPFLDITARLGNVVGSRGLLSVAFPPDYASSQHFYVNYVVPPVGCEVGCGGNLVIARYHVTADPDIADANSEEIVLNEGPFPDHWGGELAFGPLDGYLYFGLGSGAPGDSNNGGQDLSVLPGKIMRIDVETGNPATYTIPPTNPYVATANARPEIWDIGLRNPWSSSFDRQTGDYYIADVGAATREEVDFEPAGSAGGVNYGWSIMEGSLCFDPPTGCDTTGLTLPVFEYDHSVGCDISGGTVYRAGRYPSFYGIYYFGDFCTGRLWGLQQVDGSWQNALLFDTTLSIIGFSEDESGQLWVSDYDGGAVYPLVEGPPTPINLSITQTESADPSPLGNQLTYTLHITNNSSAAATGVVVNDNWTGSATYVSVTSDQGTCSRSGTSGVTCQVPSLAAGGTTTVTLILQPSAPGTVVNSATADANEPDTDPTDNSATEDTTITSTIQITVQTNLAGLAFTVDGVSYNATQTFSWDAGSSHTIGTTSPQNGGTGVRYVWTRWSDNGAISHTVAPTTNKIYTATFRTQYYLTMTHGTGGTVMPGSGWRNSGAAVSIRATAASGYSFNNWTGTGSGSYSGTNNPASITMNGPITENASFNQSNVQITVQTNPGGRTFSVDGTTYSSTQTFSWVAGSSHTIATTSPQNGGTGIRYVWMNWSGGGAISHTVAPTSNTTYTANFRTQYYLTMTHGIGGTVSPASGWRNSGAAASISATPASGYHFTNWTGSGIGAYSGTNNPASITMGGPITETATFTHN